jgi:hypothetical protein
MFYYYQKIEESGEGRGHHQQASLRIFFSSDPMCGFPAQELEHKLLTGMQKAEILTLYIKYNRALSEMQHQGNMRR